MPRTKAEATPQRNGKKMEKRNDIYQGLKKHYGALKRLANEQKVSERWVLAVLKGESPDEDLLLAAAKLWRQLEKEKRAKLDEADRIAVEALSISFA